MKKANINDCRIIELPKVHFKAGNMSIVDGVREVPFRVTRVFWIYDIPAGEARGAHAHKECHQFIVVAASGSFEIEVDDGAEKTNILSEQTIFRIAYSTWHMGT